VNVVSCSLEPNSKMKEILEELKIYWRLFGYWTVVS